MIGQQPHGGERQPAALSSEGARNRMARTIRNMRIASTRVLVAFMTMLMVFGTTPAQLWAEGAEGIAQAVASCDAEPTEEGTSSETTGADSVATEGGNKQPAESAAASSDKFDESSSVDASASSSNAGSAKSDDEQSGNSAQTTSGAAPAASGGEADVATASNDSNLRLGLVYISNTSTYGPGVPTIKSVTIGMKLYALAMKGLMGPTGYVIPNTKVDPNDAITYQWQYSLKNSTSDSDFKDIPGATGSSFTVTQTIDGKQSAGMYFRVKASGLNGSAVSTMQKYGSMPPFMPPQPKAPVGPVAGDTPAKDDAASIVSALGSYKPTFTYGSDTNANDVLLKKIKSLGKTGATVKVVSAQPSSAPAGVEFGVSSVADTNGQITYFSYDCVKNSASVDLSAAGSVDLVYEISYKGTTARFSASGVKVPLDTKKMASYLDQAKDSLSIQYAAGDSASSITRALTLPVSVGSAGDIQVDWTSSNTSAIAPATSAGAASKVTRKRTDADVTLTATLYYKQLGKKSSSLLGTKTFDVTVKADPAKANEVEATVSVIGADASGAQQTWASPKSFVISKNSTVADISVKAFADAGLTYSALGEGNGWYLSTITSPNDSSQTLGWDSVTGKYWQLFVNGKAADKGAGELKIAEGDKIVWSYSEFGATAPTEQVAVRAYIVGRDANDNEQTWAIPENVYVDKGASAAEVTQELCRAAGIKLTYQDSAYGFFLTSMTSPFDSTVTLDNSKWNTTGETWQLFFGKAGKTPTYAQMGASSLKVEDGDQVVWYYGKSGKLPDDVSASARVIGRDASGHAQYWGTTESFDLISNATVADLSNEYFSSKGIKAKTVGNGPAWAIESLTSPYDASVELSSSITGATWKLFINGKPSSELPGSRKVSADDSIVWCYTDSDTLSDPSAFVSNPEAKRPDWTAEWSGFGNGGNSTLNNTPTPTDATAELWKVDLKTPEDKWVSLGDPIIAGGYVFVMTNTQLVKIDASGNVVARVDKGGKSSYFSRPVYADGLIISANDNGSIYAFSAETLECVWHTDPLAAPAMGGSYQANSTMTVANGCVYAEFEAGAGATGTASAGAMICVDIATGQVKWTQLTTKSGGSTGEGYYWAGAAVSGSDLVIGDESGYVKLVDGSTGAIKSSVKLSGAPIRSTVVYAGTEGGKQTYLVVTRQPATMYKIVRDGDTLSIATTADGNQLSCAFANTSTSTPAVANGKAYIGGNDSSNNGVFAVIDLATMKVETTVNMGKFAEVKASPLVCVQGGTAYAYFTCNKTPGALFCFDQSTGKVAEVYTPSGNEANYCTASVIADASGNLYYTNDSGTLFALKAAPGFTVTFDSGEGSVVPSVRTAQNKAMSAPVAPARDGYIFVGWYTDKALVTAWDFSKPVTGDMTLYAKWEKKTTPAVSTDSSDKNAGVTVVSTKVISNGGASFSIALRSNATALTKDGACTSLLDGFESSDATVRLSTDEGAARGGKTQVEERTLPIWPFIGMACGAAILIIVVVARKRKKGENNE